MSSSPLDQDEADESSRFVIVKPPSRLHTTTRRNDNAVAIVYRMIRLCTATFLRWLRCGKRKGTLTLSGSLQNKKHTDFCSSHAPDKKTDRPIQ